MYGLWLSDLLWTHTTHRQSTGNTFSWEVAGKERESNRGVECEYYKERHVQKSGVEHWEAQENHPNQARHFSLLSISLSFKEDLTETTESEQTAPSMFPLRILGWRCHSVKTHPTWRAKILTCSFKTSKLWHATGLCKGNLPSRAQLFSALTHGEGTNGALGTLIHTSACNCQ